MTRHIFRSCKFSCGLWEFLLIYQCQKFTVNLTLYTHNNHHWKITRGMFVSHLLPALNTFVWSTNYEFQKARHSLQTLWKYLWSASTGKKSTDHVHNSKTKYYLCLSLSLFFCEIWNGVSWDTFHFAFSFTHFLLAHLSFYVNTKTISPNLCAFSNKSKLSPKLRNKFRSTHQIKFVQVGVPYCSSSRCTSSSTRKSLVNFHRKNFHKILFHLRIIMGKIVSNFFLFKSIGEMFSLALKYLVYAHYGLSSM